MKDEMHLDQNPSSVTLSKEELSLFEVTESEKLLECPICQKDLKNMLDFWRPHHINRCLDQQLNKLPETTQCPFCDKTVFEGQGRISHLKACAKKFNVSTIKLIEILNVPKSISKTTELFPLVKRPLKNTKKTKINIKASDEHLPTLILHDDEEKRKLIASRVSAMLEDHSKISPENNLSEVSIDHDTDFSKFSLSQLKSPVLTEESNLAKETKAIENKEPSEIVYSLWEKASLWGCL